MDDPRNKPDEYWKKKLTPEQYKILRDKGTKASFIGKFYKNFESGMYECVVCRNRLFSSDTKFDSDCGWPSFDKSLEGNVEFRDDNSLGMQRTEVLCKKCGGHLGHLFNDLPRRQAGDPTKTGLRYCINSVALNFRPE